MRAALAVNDYRPKSDTLYAWVTDHWEYDTRAIYTYDINGLLLEKLIEQWNGSAWTRQSRRQISYNPQGLQVVSILQFWFGGQWVNAERTLSEYEPNGQLSVVTFQEWDSGTPAWINASRNLLTYDDGLLSVDVLERWRNDEWDPELRTSYQYNLNDHVSTESVETHSGDDWDDLLYWMNSYNVDGLLIERVQYLWTPVGEEPQVRFTYTYNASGLETLNTRSFWLNDAWQAVSSVQTKYGGDRVVEVVTTNSFFNTTMSRRLYSYDDANMATEEIAQIRDDLGRDGGAATWRNISRTVSVSEAADPVCLCPCQGDVGPRSSGGDTYINLVDVVTLVDIAFFNGELGITDPNCPNSRADVAPLDGCGDGLVDVVDVTVLIDYAFLKGPAPCNPCVD
ncbi:MAG: hypothetical protein GF341_11325 [candidate division Zixibacteria bacterium]|nr:hypothetical protein [candidate division Zixibacteria bacterium]